MFSPFYWKFWQQALLLLSSVSQSPPEKTMSAMKLSVEALVKPNLLKHKDKDVRLLVATCISEVMRIVAPEAPYEDDILRDVFELIVASFKGLNETSSPHYERRVNILEAVATYRSCIVMLDLDCDDLIQEMFQIFFSTVREGSKSVMEYMKTILCLVLNESEEIPQHLLELILGNLLSEKKGVSRAGCRLARAVVKECSQKLRPHVEAFLDSTISKEKSSARRLSESYADLMYEIYACAPILFVPAVSKLTEELLTDELDVRLKAVALLGRIFSSQQGVSDLVEGIYLEYLKRFTDKAVDVRLAMVKCAKQCLLAHPSGPKARDFLSALSDRLQDFETEVRLHAVLAICDVAQSNPQLTLVNEMKRVAERLRDKEVTVRQYTQQRLMDLYKSFCSKKVEGISVHTDTFYWIPCKLIRSSCDKDSKEFRMQGMELVSEQLFPSGFPVKETVKCWIEFFRAFDDYDRKAFHYILHQKQRLHSDMRNLLLLRQKLQDEESQEMEARILSLCKSLSSVFADSSIAENQLRKLTQLKDSKLFKDLSDLLDPNIAMAESFAIMTSLLKRLGEKHPLYGFLKVLSLKCSYALFGKEHMRILITELRELISLEDESLLRASMALVVDFTNHFPSLLDGVEDDLIVLLNKDIDFIKDGAVQVLAKVGGSMRGRFPEGSKSVNILGDLCVEGSRKQAKHAVQALAAMSNDSGLTVFSGLYRKLLDLLESSINLPTILQSLGCIAQHAMSVFEAHEEDLVNFLVREIFRRGSIFTQAPCDSDDHEQHPVGEITGLKIFGIKTLVRSFLPNKDFQQVQRLKGLFKILLKFLESGEIADDIKSSGTDKAHLRLAAAKGVLRLSKRYDAQISPQLFKATVSCAQECSVVAKCQFLGKVEKLLKERQIPLRYACILAISIGVSDDDYLQAKQRLSDFVEFSRRQVRFRDPLGVGQLDSSSLTYYPEHVLFHLVHVLAHRADFRSMSEGGPNSEEVELHVKQLYLFLWALLNHSMESVMQNEDRDKVPNSVSLICGIFYALKNAEDVVDASKTESTYILCDIGIAILKRIMGAGQLNAKEFTDILLPNMIYKSAEATVKSKEKIDGSYLPDFVADGSYFLRLLPSGMDMSVTNRKRKVDQVESAFLEKEERHGKNQRKVAVSPGKTRKTVQKQIKGAKSSDNTVWQGVDLPSELSDDDERAQVMHGINSSQEKSTDMDSPEKSNVNALSPKKKRKSLKEDEPVQKEEKDIALAGKKRNATQKEILDGKASGDDIKEDELSSEHLGGKKAVTQTGIQKEKGNKKSAAKSEKIAVREHDEDETLLSAMQKQKRIKSMVEIDEVVKDEARLSSPKMVINDKEATTFEAVDSPRKHVRISIKEPKPPRQEPVDRDNTSGRRHHGKKMLDDILSVDSTLPDKKMVDSPQNEVADNAGAQAQGSKDSGLSPRKYTKSIDLEGPKLKVGKKKESFGKELLNKRVQVYWPMDKRFYQGTIRSFNPVKKLHEVIYDDGDKETLDLRKERWELLEEDELSTEESPSAAKVSKRSSQSKVIEERFKKKKDLKDLSSSSNPIDAIEDGESVDDGDRVFDGREASTQVPKQKSKARMSSKKVVSSTGPKGTSLNDQTFQGAISFDEPEVPDDDVPLDAWKPLRKKDDFVQLTTRELG
ncbi:hypothetical protein GOP47_0017621 [Adiantum capillus-veneris]|uniref:Tudor domain-containing protein n=1 Tax=Adiantum capillus-veneris TaxID=13818 RepID=A0A9D4UFP4_ADICA|nr:hypothetical protein GOP47_0017621 [Adiantum capillus-veneris]